MAYSATAVLPADVWAATKIDSFLIMHSTAFSWNVSSLNKYSFANTFGLTKFGLIYPFGDMNSWMQFGVYVIFT